MQCSDGRRTFVFARRPRIDECYTATVSAAAQRDGVGLALALNYHAAVREAYFAGLRLHALDRLSRRGPTAIASAITSESVWHLDRDKLLHVCLATEALAAIPDSIFDHTADVEFVLDPVKLRRERGRGYTPVPTSVRGETASITF